MGIHGMMTLGNAYICVISKLYLIHGQRMSNILCSTGWSVNHRLRPHPVSQITNKKHYPKRHSSFLINVKLNKTEILK